MPGSDLGPVDFSQLPQPSPSDPREGLAPGAPSGNDAIDRERGKGVYYVDPGSYGSGGGEGNVAPPAPSPTPPDPWIRSSSYVAPSGVKQADPDIVLFNEEAVSPERLIELQYQDISGTELINISRSDIIDGQKVSYSPVKNFSDLRRKYNPNNIIALPANSSSYFSKFAINLVLRGINEPYFDQNGNLVIEIDNVLDDEIIEVEVDTNGTIDSVDFS